MPENSINLTVTPAQLVQFHNALIDYSGKISGIVSALSFANLPTTDAEKLYSDLRALSAMLTDKMTD